MQDTNVYITSCERKSSALYRMISVTLLALLLFVCGSVLLVSAAPANSVQRPHRSMLQAARIRPQQPSPTFAAVTPTPTMAPTPAPTPRPTPLAVRQLPITPFPATFAAQEAVLTAHDRLLYHGNTALSEVALTFDDGPNPPYTDQILAILHRYQVKATFFCVGNNVLLHPATVQKEYLDGHLIGNHTYAHPYMPALAAPSVIWQLSAAADTIQHTIGVRPAFFRPPYGAFNSTVLTYANYYALSTALWNDDPRDWSMPGVNVIVNRVLQQVGNGSIILLHDGGGDRWQTVAALPFILTWLLNHGFRFVTLQQLVHDLHTKSSLPSSGGRHPLPKRTSIWRQGAGGV